MKYVLRRLGFYLLAFWAALTLDFVLPRMLPGDPAAAILGPIGSRMTEAQINALRQALGLSDAPLWDQYLQFVSHVFQGDFGLSYSSFPAPVTQVIGTGFAWTLLLGLSSLTISVIVGHLIGIFGAWRRGSTFDVVMPPLFNFVGAFPAFFLALGAVFIFGFKLKWFPIAHATTDHLAPGWTIEYIGSILQHLFLPMTVAVLVNLQVWIQTMRNNMISVLAEDYITMSEAKGLTQNRIMFGYAARNAILPSITGFGIFLGSILGGQVLIEQVFAYPGLGFLLVKAVGARDYPLMGGLFLGITVGVLLINFVVDLLYPLIDPRVRAS